MGEDEYKITQEIWKDGEKEMPDEWKNKGLQYYKEKQ